MPYSPSDVWLIRRRGGEEAGGRMVGLGRRLVVAAGGDANSDKQQRRKGRKRQKESVGGQKTERGFQRHVICKAHSKHQIVMPLKLLQKCND